MTELYKITKTASEVAIHGNTFILKIFGLPKDNNEIRGRLALVAAYGALEEWVQSGSKIGLALPDIVKIARSDLKLKTCFTPKEQ